MNDTQIEGNKQDYFKYKVAGWFAFASAALTAPIVLMSLIIDIRPRTATVLIPILVLLGLFDLIFSLYAIYQLRNFLNERYQFHEADTLITILIYGSIVITFIAYLGRAFPAIAIPALVMLIAVGVPLSIVGIMFGVKLLKLRASLYGLLKPLAYIHIIASVFFMTIVLAFVGQLVMAAFSVLLGIMFLQGEEEEKLDFV